VECEQDMSSSCLTENHYLCSGDVNSIAGQPLEGEPRPVVNQSSSMEHNIYVLGSQPTVILVHNVALCLLCWVNK